MFSAITNAFGLSTRAGSTSDSSIAEPGTTAVQFPAANSQQRARAPAVPSFEISDSDETSARLGLDDDDDDDDSDAVANLPTVSVTETAAPSLAPPTTTTKVLKAPKGRVRVEKGFSQLDWAKLNRSGEVDLRGGATELRRISTSEMALHNTKEDCWQAYNGKVYNVGPFLRYHPGGGGEMMRGAGKDVLAHAWVNYETLLENCLIGFLVRD
ncbi:cytochrome b5-like heme/steroid binding domain-containing protein [Sporobolomyces koalae]|uniref:cytochrome b5-like heme/steroid binding domain-containing protein n=1 Tax=Sporobolomyces koalae TaxID=500713 RepID=UPI00317CE8F6